MKQCRESLSLVPYKPHVFSPPSAPAFVTHLTDDEKLLRTKVTSTFESAKPTNIPGSLLFLGTGSAVPSKYRNGSHEVDFQFLVSSMLLELPSGELALLDCGEGMMVQLLRLYPTTWKSLLCRLRFVIISHSHADHHLGLPLLLRYYCIARNGGEEGMDGTEEIKKMDGVKNRMTESKEFHQKNFINQTNPSEIPSSSCSRPNHLEKMQSSNDLSDSSSAKSSKYSPPFCDSRSSDHSVTSENCTFSEKRLQPSDDRLLIFGPPRVGVFLQHLAHLIPFLRTSFHFVSIQLPNASFYLPANQSTPSIVASAATATFPIPHGVSIAQTQHGSLHIDFPSGTLTVFPVQTIEDAD